MKTIVVTGGIASGKSSFCALLESRDTLFLDCDSLVSHLLKKEEIKKKIDALSDENFRNSDLSLNKEKLREKLFLDTSFRFSLENILHPLVHEELLAVQKKVVILNTSLFVVEIPLFFEKKVIFSNDQVVLVVASRKAQEERLLHRWGNLVYLENILASQIPVEEKISQADVVVWNDGNIECLKMQMRIVLENL